MAKIKNNLPEKSKDIPVTLGMLHLVRDELRSDIRSLEHKMDSKFSVMDSKFSAMDSKFSAMDSKISTMDSKLEKMMSQMHQMHSLAEEQNARNKVVMDGLTFLFERQERGEKTMEEFKRTLAELGAK